jgi:hypothetical protein
LFDPSNPSLAPASLLGLFSCWPLLAALKLGRSSSAVATRLKRVLVTKAPARRGVKLIEVILAGFRGPWC